MKKTTFLMVALFLALFSFGGYAEPSWSGNTSATPANYNSSTYSLFNVTWSNSTNTTTVNTTEVKIVANFSGLEQNYTMNPVSGNEYDGNYGYQEILGAGTYQWRSCAIDNETSENCTDYYDFSIAKSSMNSHLNVQINGSASNKTIVLPSIANITAFSNATGDSDVTYALWRNDTQLVTGNDTWDASVIDRGVYKFFYNSTEGTNWTSGTTNSLYLFVTDLNFSNDNVIPSPATYSPSANYSFSIKLTGNISKVFFEAGFSGTLVNYTNATNVTNWNKTITLYNDTIGNYWINFTDLSASAYQYRWIANDTNNIWVNTSQSYVINPLTVPISLGVNGGWTTTTSTQTTILCSATGYQLNLSLIGGCIVTGGNSISCTYPTGSNDGGSVSFTCSVSPVFNYTGLAQGTLQWYKPSWSNDNQNTGSGGNQQVTGSFTLVPSTSNVTLESGTSSVITLSLKNTLSGDMMNLSVSASGIDPSWYSLDKINITRLRRDGGNDTVKLTLNIPKDAEAKTYSIAVTATGKDFNFNTISRRTTITLTVAKEEAPINITEETSETANETAGEVLSNEANQTKSPTGLIVRLEDFKNIVLFVGLIAIGLVFIFRSNVTEFFMRGHKSAEHEPRQELKSGSKKTSTFSSIKNKFSSFNDRKIVIQVKKKEKDKA